jgi:2-methylcitrate dehydratase PrpD
VAVFGKLAYPEMKRAHYDRSFALGSIASSGSFACMIPPSGMFILFAIFTDLSVGKLFMAGLIPGIFTAAVYAGSMYLRARLKPSLAPMADFEKHVDLRKRVRSVSGLWEITLLALIVIGGIYSGVLTPTGAGAVGALGAFLIGVFRGPLRKLAPNKQALRETAFSSWDQGGRNTVFGRRRSFQPPAAALINGTAAHALDFDDNFIPAFTHASAVLVPALLALGENRRLSGAALIDAYIVGSELQTRIGLLVNPGHFKKGWHATATVGTIGTAGACARLIGLNAEQIETAMSIAFSLASGSKKQFGTMMKPIHAGLAAQHAVMAAVMAEAGISAQPGFLTGDLSLQHLYGEIDSSREPAAMIEPGEALCLSRYGLLVKRFPCCGSAHKSLDGFLALREQHRPDPDRIRRAVTWLPETLSRNLRFPRPQNPMEARFSLQYPVARILLEGWLSLRHFTPSALWDPAILALLDRIQVETIPDPPDINPSTPLMNRLEMTDGSVWIYETGPLRGALSNPLSADDIRRKFEDCIRFAAIESVPEKQVRQMFTIDHCSDIAELMDGIRSLMPEAFVS